ncbi:MAG: DEAD/DEAH box helicase [Chloroflexi bacterium]|nr:DEAD/DEAH box helicase [Chloroflexota bacterium]
MLPSLLAADILESLKQFLVTDFEPSDAFLHGLMRRFIDDEAQWLKGPYVQIGLPFAAGAHGTQFFRDFATPFPAYSHQERAWERLCSDRRAASTLVATGTGSGKTECFLYPLLDHCARARRAGEGGIKALVIYPMNALASDQARRIAALIARVPHFQGLRVGMYVGGTAAGGGAAVMSQDGVITDRETLRRNPPDVLLTNYKMLDYLMLRPRDRKLWAQNGPTTLRYVIVDELHTFDGAQGTDLALLLRRLRARLAIPDGHLIYAGTSATLGADSADALLDYARAVFGAPFEPDAVVTENRQSVGQFLEDATIDAMFVYRPETAARLDPTRFDTPQDAVRDWFALFFPEAPAPDDVDMIEWRIELGRLLKSHQLFQNLLKLTRTGAPSYKDLTATFGRGMPADAAPRVLDALLTLVAWARHDARTPLVTLRLQLWVRELRRMVGHLSVRADDVRLVSETDLPADRDGLYLPLVQCSQCRTTGWISRVPTDGQRLSSSLEEIYGSWFGRRQDVVRLYASESLTHTHSDGIRQHVCTACGTLHMDAVAACTGCGHPELLPVFRVLAQKVSERGAARFVHHDPACPACGSAEQLLLGARNATLGAQVIDGAFASLFNDDKKLIAFSDSVQDAAHRAGFFSARTWSNNLRTALAHAIDEICAEHGARVLPWPHFLAALERRFDQPGSVLHLPPEAFVAEFIAPDMTWQRDWSEELLGRGRLPHDSRLPARIRRRVAWQAFAELTYASHRGRTLERSGKAIVAVPWARIGSVAAQLAPALREEFDMRDLHDDDVARWLWGVLTQMRRRGGVLHPELKDYAADANVYVLANKGGRGEWMPRLSPATPRPIFLTQGTQSGFDRLRNDKRSTWYDRWTAEALCPNRLLMHDMAAELLAFALPRLASAGLLLRSEDNQGATWALDPSVLELHTEPACIATRGGKRRLFVPADDADALLGAPCLDAPDERYDVRVNDPPRWWARRFSRGDLRRVIAAEHTGLLERSVREALEKRFKGEGGVRPWYENLLSATPTLEMGVDIGDLSSVLLCSVPRNTASFQQRIGRAGRRDGNAVTTTLADGASPHDLNFFAETHEMMSGKVEPPGVFLRATEVLRRQLAAFCIDDWVAGCANDGVLPEKTAPALDAVDQARIDRFPYLLRDHIVKHEARLFDGFTRLMGDDLDAAGRERLLEFMHGSSEVTGQSEADGLNVRLIKILEELLEERRSYRKRRDDLDQKLKKLRAEPQDDAVRERIDDVMRERDALLELIKEINQRERANDEPGDSRYVTVGTFTYERPAQSALSEFAPENRFYANQRRVEVDQIAMAMAKVEQWRFCPSCQHMQNLEVDKTVHAVCPRCGDGMWADAGQKRTLLRFRQAIANNNDQDARIDDSADDREPRFYLRQLLPDFERRHIVSAWRTGTDAVPFGFEFISRVAFREVNFGETGRLGQEFSVASRAAARPGFRLCRHCGKVQTPPHRDEPPDVQRHAIDCSHRGSTDPADVLECLYLYREFESEALRILVPFTRSGMDERVVQSFSAALRLGLKKRFGGRIDHLQVTMTTEPGSAGGPQKFFVMLYDTVPGGTGYLQQLLTHDAGTLTEVVKLALQAVRDCACRQDPIKDGCYRCVYQFRQGRDRSRISRSIAEAVLGELEGALGDLERVASISEIYVNPRLDSVLEMRFLECLARMSGVGGLPAIRMIPDIVDGRSGYVLDVGGQRYTVAPQRELGPSDGVSVACRPDFLIRPWSTSTPKRRPIAVFCDGWTFHQERLRDDAIKRSAIVASGRFWVWSVTHEDVAAALQAMQETDLESPFTTMARHDGQRASAQTPRASAEAYTRHAVAVLLRWLAKPTEATSDAGLSQLQSDALWLGFRMVPNSKDDIAAAKSTLAAWSDRLPAEVTTPDARFALIVSKENGACLQFGLWPTALAKHGLAAPEPWQAPGVIVLDEHAAADGEALQQAWRQWLRLFNTAQTLPGMRMATAVGLASGDGALAEDVAPEAPNHATPWAAGNAVWEAVLDQAHPSMHAGLASLARAGAEPPEVGLELTDPRGRVIADCELAWAHTRIVVLRDDQREFESLWQAQGWHCRTLDELISTP